MLSPSDQARLFTHAKPNVQHGPPILAKAVGYKFLDDIFERDELVHGTKEINLLLVAASHAMFETGQCLGLTSGGTFLDFSESHDAPPSLFS